MNLYKARLVDALQILHGQFSGIQPLILDLKASADSNLFKLIGSSSHILGPNVQFLLVLQRILADFLLCSLKVV